MLWEILTLHAPWEDLRFPSHVFKRVAKGDRPTIAPDDTKRAMPGYVDLLRRCWHQEPDGRPDFRAIFNELSAISDGANGGSGAGIYSEKVAEDIEKGDPEGAFDL